MPAGARVTPALLVVIGVWGGAYAAVKSVGMVIPPVPLATFRCLVSAVLLGIGLALAGRGLPRLGAREWATLVLLGLSGNTLFQLCMIGGLHYTTPAHSALMIALNPIFAALLAWAWLGERPVARRTAGILLALAGVVLIVTRASGIGGGSLLGDLLSVGAALAWAVYSVAAKPLLATYPTLEVTALSMAAGALPLLPLGLPGLAAVPWATLDLRTWLLLGYLTVITMVMAYFLWYWALARAATAQVMVFTYLTPVVATAISVAVGHDTLTSTLVAGAVAVVAGVALAQRAPARGATARVATARVG